MSPSGNVSLIDLAMLSDIKHLQYCTTVPPLSTSDHLGVSLALKWETHTQRYISKPRRVWLYNDADFSRACRMIDETDWNLLLSDDVDISAEQWTKHFLYIMEECIPSAIIKSRKNLPWLNTNIIRHMRKRNNMFRKAKRSHKKQHLLQFKKLRNECVTMLRQEKLKYFNSLSGASNKTFWKTMKCLNKKEDTIPSLQEGNNQAINDKEKSDMLNMFFSLCWNSSEPPLFEADDTTHCENSRTNFLSLEDLLCTHEQVLHLLRCLDTGKANGPDNISACMLKETASSIAPSLTHLFNLSIAKGRFPRLWKAANVVNQVTTNIVHLDIGQYPFYLLSVKY